MKSKHKKYTIEHLEFDAKGNSKKGEPIIVEHYLLKARTIARQLFKEGRFVSLKNNKGIPLPL